MGWTGVEGEADAKVMVGLGQDQGQVQIKIELDVLSVESMITLQENVQLCKKTER